MATAADLITAAFIKVGVDSPVAAQTASALISLNNMISLLGADMLQGVVVTESFSVVAADAEYTIGSGGQWDTVRPMAVKSCFLRNDDDYDTPVKILSSQEYINLSNKAFSARPTGLYFLPEYPLAKIIFNTSPNAGYDAYFEFVKNFTEFALTSTSVALPPEYKEALVYNLAVSLAEDWDRVVPKSVYEKAMMTREIIDHLNATTKRPPLLRFDFAGMGGTSDAGYDVVTDDVIDGGAF